MEKSVQITSIIVVAIVVLGFATIYTFQKSIPPEQRGPTISASGEASIKTSPDLIVIYFQISTKSKSASESSVLNQEIFDNIKIKLISAGFKEEDIKTESFSTYEEFDWAEGGSKSLGFRTVHSLKIEINSYENEKAGEVIDIVSSEDALISYINFELSQENQNKYKSEALKLAAEDAKIKAQAIAEGAGQKIGKLVSISSSDYFYQPFRSYSNDAMASGSAVAEEAVKSVQIQPDETNINAIVTAVYQVK